MNHLTLKIKFLSGRKNLKNTDYKNVFINEDLTKLRFKLFQMVRPTWPLHIYAPFETI
jgi:hypothetical protein